MLSQRTLAAAGRSAWLFQAENHPVYMFQLVPEQLLLCFVQQHMNCERCANRERSYVMCCADLLVLYRESVFILQGSEASYYLASCSVLAGVWYASPVLFLWLPLLPVTVRSRETLNCEN